MVSLALFSAFFAGTTELHRGYWVLGVAIATSALNLQVALADLAGKVDYLRQFLSPDVLAKQVHALVAKLDAGVPVSTPDLGDAIRAALDACAAAIACDALQSAACLATSATSAAAPLARIGSPVASWRWWCRC